MFDFSENSTNSPPLPEPSSVMATAVASPAAAGDSALLSTAQVAPQQQQQARLKQSNTSQLSLDSESGAKWIKY